MIWIDYILQENRKMRQIKHSKNIFKKAKEKLITATNNINSKKEKRNY